MTKQSVYDMLIVGGGPAGYTAALYGARAGLDVAVLERLSPGGQMALTHRIENYPGFPEGVDGYELGQKMLEQARLSGADTVNAQVNAVELAGQVKTLHTSAGSFFGKTVVLATGADPRPLGLPEESGLVGKGVAYCAACDGMFYRGKTVVVVGGGNTAAGDALLLSRVAKKVILVHRSDKLRAAKIYQKALQEADNVEFRWNSQVQRILFGDKVTGVQLLDKRTGEQSSLDCDGVFVSIGRQPATALVKGLLDLDRDGYVVAGEDTKTNIPGVFAVGDVRTKELRQIVTAVADGAVAAEMAQHYLA